MCAPSELAYQLFAPALKLPEGCHLPNACGYIFSNLPGMTGFSGSFTNTQLRTLERCLPSAIYYREVDQAVHKAEDSPFWHAQAGSVPAGAEQQQQPEGKQPGGRRSLRQAGASTRSVTPAGEEPHLVHSFDGEIHAEAGTQLGSYEPNTDRVLNPFPTLPLSRDEQDQ